ncbi:hypothetical protein PM082_018328 [Marasmius tenuissimus]|nr:hypothetical protein PM082_018328 [Marasmius tenuissimus]
MQAQHGHPESASKLRYRWQETQRILREATQDWSNLLQGLDYLRLIESGEIDENTMVLLFSEGSAQLYRDKDSSTRFSIAISGDLAPDVRHLESSVIPQFVVGGPNSAQHDSFSLLTLAHLAACQRRGIKVWDSLSQKVIKKHPFLLFALADTVAMTDMSKSVGHHGRNGCRLLCNMPGRHKPGVGTYYPVAALTVEEYQRRLQRVLDAPNVTQYKKRRKKTGVRGPSLFSVLPKALPCPKLFPADLMHLYYNLNQLLVQLWRGDIDYTGDDDPASWPFAILHDPDKFAEFGLAVERASRYIPTCVESRIPRNPVAKINSQYKASYSRDVSYGHTSLHPRDQHLMDPEDAQLFKDFCVRYEWQDVVDRITPESLPTVERFARLRLPKDRLQGQDGKRRNEKFQKFVSQGSLRYRLRAKPASLKSFITSLSQDKVSAMLSQLSISSQIQMLKFSPSPWTSSMFVPMVEI